MPKMKEFLKSELLKAQETEVFWRDIFSFVNEQLKGYFSSLRRHGVNPVLLAAVSKNNLEETTQEKINHIQEVLIALSQLQGVFQQQDQKVSKLQKDLMAKEQQLKQIDSEQQQTKEYIEDLSRKIELQPKQVRSDICKELITVRDRVRVVNELINNENAQEKYPRIQSKVNDAVHNICEVMSELNLWPENEKKPEVKKAKPKTASKLRGRKKQDKSDSNIAPPTDSPTEQVADRPIKDQPEIIEAENEPVTQPNEGMEAAQLGIFNIPEKEAASEKPETTLPELLTKETDDTKEEA